MFHGIPGLRPRKRKGLPSLLRRVTPGVRSEIILSYLESLDSPVALSTWLLFKNGEFRQLVERGIKPADYNCPDTFRRDYAASRFFAKCADLPTGIDTKSVALESAQKAEELCRSANERFREFFDNPGVNPALLNLLPKVSECVSRILGPLRPGTFRDSGWSKGRTTSAFGDWVTPPAKYRSRLDCTLSAIPTAVSVVGSSHLWSQSALQADGPVSVLPSAFTPVMGNHLIVVPKNAKTDRSICYEPHANIRLQLSVGSYLRQRLHLAGVNLDDQSVNQRRARIGSKTGSLATIDLKSASDSMSVLCVMACLPIDWFRLLDSLRSKYTLWPDGEWRENEKFSSMGNGFTFELESLLFYAICSAVTSNVSVYGDDLIVPTEHFGEVCAALECFGFTVNDSKSFSEGYFRESCGSDCFAGLNVTPVYLRRLPKTTEDVVKLHNQVRRWASVVPTIEFQLLLESWRHVVPCHHGPQGYGDGHYHVDFDNRPKARYSIDGWWFKTFVRSYPAILDGICSEIGEFQSGWGSPALCAALGPKRARSVMDQLANRKGSFVRETRVLANFEWPTVVWV